MITVSAELLGMCSEAAMLIHGGRISYLNPAAEAIFGDCRGKTLKSALGDQAMDIQSCCFSGEVCIGGKHYIIRMNGDKSASAVFLSPADSMPNIIGDAFLFSLRDGLMNLNLSMELAREQSQETGDSATLEKLRDINLIYHRMNKLSGNMSVIEGVYSGQNPFHPACFDIVPEFMDIVDTVGILAGNRELIHTEFPDRLPVFGDRQLLCLLFMELLANAMTHSGCTRIGVSIICSRDAVVLAVDDNGRGIAPEELHTVFEHFRRPRDLTDPNPGAGLGLTAARLIARMHGGTILLESRPGKGTTVRASLGKRASSDTLTSSADTPKLKMSDILTAFSGCLDPGCFSEKYTD